MPSTSTIRRCLSQLEAVARASVISLLRQRLTPLLAGFGLLCVAVALLMSTIDIGVRFRLFENLLLSAEVLLLHALALLYAFELLRRDQADMLYVLPLATALGRGRYLAGRYLGVVAALGLFVLLCVVLDLGLSLATEGAWRPLLAGQAALFGLSAALLAALVFAFAQLSSPLGAVLYAVALWLIGNGLDELYIYLQQEGGAAALALGRGLYYLLPDFSFFDLTSRVINRDPIAAADWLFAVAYGLGYSALALLFAARRFRRRVLAGGE